MLDCLGFAEGQHECDRLSGRFKRLERQILYRQLLLEEVIHRTNNTLQQAISAVDAQIAAANDAWKAHDLRALRARLRKLRGANHQLYGPGDYVGSSLKTRLSEICSSIFESFGRQSAYVALSLNVADIELQRHQEVCVCLITQELVTNALKHGFTDCFCHLIVTDNGIQKCTLYRGSGLALVEGFVSLLEGRLEFDVNQGTTVRASFPVVP
jgi:two-component sensor histidine kinase